MKITAAIARVRASPLSIEAVELEEPRDNEALIKLVGTGVCHTDIAIRDQLVETPLPVVLGHEGSGIVERVGRSVTKLIPGDHVILSVDACRRCLSCDAGDVHLCREFFSRNFSCKRPDGSTPLSQDGTPVYANFFGQSSFSTHTLVMEQNIIKVDKELPLELLGPLSCGVKTGAGAVFNSFKLKPGQSLAVFGTGPVGLSAVLAAKLAGASTVIAVDIRDARLDMAKDLGATHCVNAETEDTVDAIRKICNPGVDFIFDTTGQVNVIEQSITNLAVRGTCGVITANSLTAKVSINLMNFMHSGQILRGIVGGDANPDVFIPQMINWFRNGQFPFDRMIKFYSLEEINKALQDQHSGVTVKPVILME